jgi:poly [ADP-ribose] polymerase
MGIVRKEKYIFVDSVENHNKFWYIEEHSDGMIKTIWGRVGNTESTKTKQCGSAASKEFDKLVKSKVKKGYTLLKTIDAEISTLSTTGIAKRTLESLALEEIEFDKANKHISDMIKVFCNENIHTITSNTNITWNSKSNVFQTPCGIITQVAIKDAREILSDISDRIDNRVFDSGFDRLVEQYCMIIPQKVHGKFIPTNIFRYASDARIQENVLNSLEDSLKLIEDLQKKDLAGKKDSDKLFNASIVEVTDDAVIEKIKKLFKETHQNIHSCRNLKVKRVYEIRIDKMFENFNNTISAWKSQKKSLGRKQLWHGTKKSNIISILKNGFVIPPASAKHCTGRMFSSDGLYLSDQSTKALNYSYGWWSGTRDANCYMFLCSALMGTAYTPSGYYGCSGIPSGYDSIFAKAGKSGVQNNEMVVPLKQVNPEYLIEFGE